MLSRSIIATLSAALLLAGGASAAPAASTPSVACTDSVPDTPRLDFPNGAFGYYALPATAPKGLVVFAHGHGNSAYKWRTNLADTARDLGVIAVAMDNRGQTFPKGPTGESFGWRVREGAQDSIAAAQLFERTCLAGKVKKPKKPMKGGAAGRSRRAAKSEEERPRPIVIYGVSMGGNTSGLAVAAAPERSDGSPLWDYWFDIEGVTNAVETYLEGRAVAGPPLNNATGQTAVKEFHEENGGKSIEQDPAAYADLAVVTHAGEIGAAGLEGVVMVHGVDDGTVPFNQTTEMFSLLVGEDVPTDLFTVGRHGDGRPSGNTLEDTFQITKTVPGYSSPFSGHGGENTSSQPVIGVGFERLARLFQAGRAPRCFRAWTWDNGTYTADPEQPALPAC